MDARPDAPPLDRQRHGAPLSSVGPAVLALVAAVVTAGGAVALLAPAPGGPATVTSTGQAGPGPVALVILAGMALFAVGVTAWVARPDRSLAIVALCAAAAWMAAELAGSGIVTREARSLGSLVAALFAPLIVHLPVRTLRADSLGSPLRWFIVALYLVVAVAAAGQALTYDPFFDLHCAPSCRQGDNVFSIRADVPTAARFEMLGLLASGLGGILLSAWAIRRLVGGRAGRRRPEAMILVPTVLVGASLAAWTAARAAMVPDRPGEPLLLVPSLVLAAAVGLLGFAVAGLLIDQLRRREALHRLVDALTMAAGSPNLRATLAKTLGDERLRVAYPLDSGGFVDERGEPVDEPRADIDRAVTVIERGDAIVAVVEHDADLDPDLLDREVGAAARLAVDNERLEATVHARLRELRASRARIVEAGDAARSRLERDLHDGAQQRLLALSFELRLVGAALARVEVPEASRAAIEQAVEETDLALADLRDLARGIHPVVLTEDGLEGALASLAESAGVPLVVRGGGTDRCTAQSELAGYLAVVEAVRQAEAQGIEHVDVAVEQSEGSVRVVVAGPGADDRGWLRVEDRVGAAGGRFELVRAADGGATLTAELPCA
jgi:signal transduction histidine kinase